MIRTFKLEDAFLQLTAKDLDNAMMENRPLWIALSKGTQCIAGFKGGRVNHLDLGVLFRVHGLDAETILNSYLLQQPWISHITDPFDGE